MRLSIGKSIIAKFKPKVYIYSYPTFSVYVHWLGFVVKLGKEKLYKGYVKK